MKYEIGFVEPTLLDFIIDNYLDLPTIIFKETKGYDTDQMLQYIALRKQCISNDIEVNVSLKSKFGEPESIWENVYNPIKKLEDLLYDGDINFTKASSYSPNQSHTRHVMYEYVEDIDRNTMYDVRPIHVEMTSSSIGEFVRRMKDVSEKAGMMDESLSHMIGDVTSYHLTGTSDFDRSVNDFIVDRRPEFATRSLRVIKSRKEE